MAHASTLQLEDRLSGKENPFPALTRTIAEFFLDTFSPERRVLRHMQEEESQEKFMEAAQYAIGLRLYKQAFTLYDKAIAKGNWRANIPAAELAEWQGNYELGLQYRLRAEDFAYAGMDAAHLGRHDEANKYWKRLRGD